MKTNRFLFAAGIALATAFTFSCSSDPDDGPGTSSSSGGGDQDKGNDIENYKTVVIGTQTWMAENLNYNVSGSKCYGEGSGEVYYYDTGDYVELSKSEIQANCNTYGRLYNWATAMGIDANYNGAEWGESDVKRQGICPQGWHIPSDDDWDVLLRYVDEQNGGEGEGKGTPYYESETAGKYLKAMRGWNDDGNGTDKYEFSALPGGDGNGEAFGNVGVIGRWWSARESNTYEASYRYMFYNLDNAFRSTLSKSLLFSVRCLQD